MLSARLSVRPSVCDVDDIDVRWSYELGYFESDNEHKPLWLTDFFVTLWESIYETVCEIATLSRFVSLLYICSLKNENSF